MTCLRLALVADTSLTVHLPLSLAYRSAEYTTTAFSSIKAWLRANRDYVLGEIEGDGVDPYRVIWEAIHSVTLDNTYSWFQHSEYIA